MNVTNVWDRLLFWRTNHPILREHQQELKLLQERHRRERTRLAPALKADGQFYSKKIVAALTQMGICYRFPKSRKDLWEQGVQQVKLIPPIIASPETIYIRVDVSRLPRNIALPNLMKEEVKQHLSGACQHPVWWEYSPERGFWFCIDRTIGHRGVPSFLAYNEAMANLPENAGPLEFVVGAGINSRMIRTDLTTCPHLLVAGATGAGKSVFVNAILTTFIKRNSPDDLKIYLVDLKEGVEFGLYEGLPHLAREVVTSERGSIDVLSELIREVRRRMNMFRNVCRDIDGWNRQRPQQKLPYILFCVDELANLMLFSMRVKDEDSQKTESISKIAERRLARLAAISRAAGIHIIAATQRPSVDVVSGLIKANFPTRVALRTADEASSRVVIDTVDAARLGGDLDEKPEKVIRGRMIFLKEYRRLELQGPFISMDMIMKAIQEVRNMQIPADPMLRDATELFAIALTNFGGECAIDTLFEYCKSHGPGLSKNRISIILKNFEGMPLQIGDSTYELQPSQNTGDGRTSRYLMRIAQTQNPKPEISGITGGPIMRENINVPGDELEQLPDWGEPGEDWELLLADS